MLISNLKSKIQNRDACIAIIGLGYVGLPLAIEFSKKYPTVGFDKNEERIIDTEKELMSSEEDLKVFMDRNRRIENSPALQLEKQRLGREVTVLTGVFTTLKQQLETTKIEEVKESDYVIILDAPEVPLKRSKPNKRLIVILSGILGIGLGMALAFMREFAVNSDKEEKDKMTEAKSLIFKNITELIPGKSK